MKRKLTIIMAQAACLLTSAQGLDNHEASDMLANMKDGEKAALLMVHFGTTYDDTRAKTIDAINEKARQAFGQKMAVRESYTSRIIMRRLKARGIQKETPLEALLRLRAEGYTHVVVQSTNIINGTEMESLRRDVEQVRPFFTDIRVGSPLMDEVDDCLRVVEILTQRIPASAKRREHVLFVGHGTEGSATAIYSQVDYMLKATGHANYHVGTIEGYPTFETALAQILADKGRSVTLVPLMFVAGDHARNDISTDWKEQLEQAGMQVELHIEGLGEVPEIQEMFIEHIRFMLGHRMRTIMEKKNIYAKQKD